MKEGADRTLSLERLACRITKISPFQGEGRQRYSRVEQTLQVRAERELGINGKGVKSQQQKRSEMEQGLK